MELSRATEGRRLLHRPPCSTGCSVTYYGRDQRRHVQPRRLFHIERLSDHRVTATGKRCTWTSRPEDVLHPSAFADLAALFLCDWSCGHPFHIRSKPAVESSLCDSFHVIFWELDRFSSWISRCKHDRPAVERFLRRAILLIVAASLVQGPQGNNLRNRWGNVCRSDSCSSQSAAPPCPVWKSVVQHICSA